MSKIRVSNLAERLGLETREVLARLRDIGVEAKTATSLIDEDLINKLSPPQAKEVNADEVRVTTNIIRRRAKVVVAPVVEEAPVVQEAPPVEIPAPVIEPVVEIEKPRIEEPPAPVVTAEPVPVEKPKAPAEPEKRSPNQARILGRMEIPGVTTRPSRVVPVDTPAPAAQSRPAASKPAEPRATTEQRPSAPRQTESRPAGQRPSDNGQRKATTTGTAPEPDRNRMRQVQLEPSAAPRRMTAGRPAARAPVATRTPVRAARKALPPPRKKNSHEKTR